MADTTEKIDIEEIMNDIRKEIKDKGYDSSMLSFDDVALNSDLIDKTLDMEESLRYAKLNFEVEAYRQLPGNAVSVFIKKVFRKFMKFYIEPIVRDQNQLNFRYSIMFSELEKKYNTLQEKLEETAEKTAALEKENEELKLKLKGEGK